MYSLFIVMINSVGGPDRVNNLSATINIPTSHTNLKVLTHIFIFSLFIIIYSNNEKMSIFKYFSLNVRQNIYVLYLEIRSFILITIIL